MAAHLADAVAEALGKKYDPNRRRYSALSPYIAAKRLSDKTANWKKELEITFNDEQFVILSLPIH